VRIGILGGTFDPVHMGHLTLAEETRFQVGLDQVWLMPAGQPWLKEGQEISSAEDRLQMVRLAIANNPYFHASADEVERRGPTYTVDTLRALRTRLGKGDELFFILGQDAMERFNEWKEPESLLELCNWAVVQRYGHQGFDQAGFLAQYPGSAGKVTLLTMPILDISGSEIRRRARIGMSLRYYLPEAVARYIERHQLYQLDNGSGITRASDIPSYRVERLLKVALERGALKYGNFTLSSGKESTYYFDVRLLSLDPEGAQLIAEAMLPILLEAGAEAVGGLTLGADPIVASIALASHLNGAHVPGFIVRKESKAHGTGQAIEGPLPSGSKVAIIDDVCTTAGSLFQAIAAAEAVGCTVVKVAAILDRKEGGSEELARRGYDFIALMSASPDGSIQVVSR
jgi:nicotinate (nicotinamide) nucleotide adenylyltransferase